ncbi:MAG: hypothetical protein F6J97_24890 [Leptolyngbya sp. SIO4C1]|nr:hypothetical protein [Leptolyngbya sp. SIO4C1]
MKVKRSALSFEQIADDSTSDSCRKPAIVFAVSDQGCGIPANKMAEIFERFHQIDASASRRKGGTGLGLSICRSIVQQHKGHIWVESRLGQGSCFYFAIPQINIPLTNSKR